MCEETRMAWPQGSDYYGFWTESCPGEMNSLWVYHTEWFKLITVKFSKKRDDILSFLLTCKVVALCCMKPASKLKKNDFNTHIGPNGKCVLGHHEEMPYIWNNVSVNDHPALNNVLSFRTPYYLAKF